MFYKGVLRSYDQNSEKGNLYFAELDLILAFSLEDFPNPNQSPQVGERVKCLIKDVEEIKQAKCIIRLDFKNSADPEPQRTSYSKDRLQNSKLNQKSEAYTSIHESTKKIDLEQKQSSSEENSGAQDHFIENEKNLVPELETAELDDVENGLNFNLNEPQIENESPSAFFTFKNINPQSDKNDESLEGLKNDQMNGLGENYSESEFILSNIGNAKNELGHDTREMESFSFSPNLDLVTKQEVGQSINEELKLSTNINNEDEFSTSKEEMKSLNENCISDHINENSANISNNEILEFVLDQTNSDQTNSDEINFQDQKESIDLDLGKEPIKDEEVDHLETEVLSDRALKLNNVEAIQLSDSELTHLNSEFVQAEKEQNTQVFHFEPMTPVESVSSESNLIKEDDVQNIDTKYQVNEIDKPKVATIEEIKQILAQQGTKQFEGNSEAYDINNQNDYIENSKEIEKTQKDSFVRKLKTKFGYKSYKPKKEKKKKEIYFNPWIILLIILIPALGYWGEKGYQKYMIYKQEQEAKAQQYMLDQEKIIEAQRKKLGKLPDKILSDETLDELLGKDRKKVQPKQEKN